MGRGRKITPERQSLKEEARRLVRRGYSSAAIAERQGVPARTVRLWTNGKKSDRRFLANTPSNGNYSPSYIVANCSIEQYQGGPFQLIVADPPWGVSIPGGAIKRTSAARPISRDYGQWDYATSDREYNRQMRGWLEAMFSLAAADAALILWQGSVVRFSETEAIAKAVGWEYKAELFWVKPNPAPVFGDRLLNGVEPVLLMVKGRPQWGFNGHEQVLNWFNFPAVHSGQRFKDSEGTPFNRAEKPVPLLRLWVEYFSKAGDWVLDAFAGSGACAEAAIRIGRNAVAGEAEEAQCKAIEARLLRVTNNGGGESTPSAHE